MVYKGLFQLIGINGTCLFSCFFINHYLCFSFLELTPAPAVRLTYLYDSPTDEVSMDVYSTYDISKSQVEVVNYDTDYTQTLGIYECIVNNETTCEVHNIYMDDARMTFNILVVKMLDSGGAPESVAVPFEGKFKMRIKPT